MEMEYVTEIHHTHTDRRPKKRPRLGWDVSHTPKIYLLDQHQHYDRLLEHLDTTTPFSGFGIKKMGESKRAHLQMDDRQSKTALEEGKLEDAVSCRAKFVIDRNLCYIGMKYTTATFATAMCNIVPAMFFLMAGILRMRAPLSEIREKIVVFRVIARGSLLPQRLEAMSTQIHFMDADLVSLLVIADEMNRLKFYITVHVSILFVILMLTLLAFSWFLHLSSNFFATIFLSYICIIHVPYITTALMDAKLGTEGRKDLFDWLSRQLSGLKLRI
ncbi:Protein MOR1 [Camellia lanceoleosa]|nr:Protein MOR1 [Camellia lanceoleosa]